MNANSASRSDHVAIRSAAAHLLSVACAARGYRAVAPGLLHGLSGTIEAHLSAAQHPRDRLLSDWLAYVGSWSVRRIANDWPGFAAATHAVLPRIVERIDAGGPDGIGG